MPQKGQDGDRYQGAGAAARRQSGGVVRLSRLSENGHQKASILLSLFSCTFWKERRDIARGAGSCGPNPNSLLFRSWCARARKAGIVVSLACPPHLPLRLRAPRLCLQPPSQWAALSATCGVTRSDQDGVGSWSWRFPATFILGAGGGGEERWESTLVPEAPLRIRIGFLKSLGSNYQRPPAPSDAARGERIHATTPDTVDVAVARTRSGGCGVASREEEPERSRLWVSPRVK